MEEWRDIKGYEGFYQVSNEGRVKSLNRTLERSNGRKMTIKGRILQTQTDKNGYEVVSLIKYKSKETKKIHRLIAEAFIPNPQNKPCIDHINTIRTDNRVENLRWCTLTENMNNPLTAKNMSCVQKKAQAYKTKKVVQYTLDGEFIKKYASINEASKENHIGNGDIANCCKGGRYATKNGQKKWHNITQCGGYKWRYDLQKI